MPDDITSPFGCPGCLITSWTGEPTALFSDDFDSYAGSTLAFQSVWSGAGNPLTTTRAYSGTWSAGNTTSAGMFSRGISPSTQDDFPVTEKRGGDSEGSARLLA